MRPDIDSIRKREQAAERGPWIVEKSYAFSGENWIMAVCGRCHDGNDCWVTTDRLRASECKDSSTEEIADFIAHSRSDIPALLDYVAELEAELASYKRAAQDRADKGGILPETIHFKTPMDEDAIPPGMESGRNGEPCRECGGSDYHDNGCNASP